MATVVATVTSVMLIRSPSRPGRWGLLIREAKERQRRRRHRGGVVALFLVVAVGSAGYAVMRASGSTPTPGTAKHLVAAAGSSERQVLPEHPSALAVGAKGALYIIDEGRNQILKYRSGHGFSVVAGDGRRGVSPAGTPAHYARLSLDGGLAVGRDGAIYFTDGGRVDVILADGRLGTVAGGGDEKLSHQPVAATVVDLANESLRGLAVGPSGELYLATEDGVYRIDHKGRLRWVVGEAYPYPPPAATTARLPPRRTAPRSPPPGSAWSESTPPGM